jgi:FixJ family two-component response regulator
MLPTRYGRGQDAGHIIGTGVVGHPTIAVIDDDEATRTGLVALMRAKGFAATGYASAEAFLAEWSAGLRCVITDIQMPGLNGIELKRRLDAMNSRAPVIMITARVEPHLHQLALASGAFCLLRKPFKSNALIDWVEKAFGQGA